MRDLYPGHAPERITARVPDGVIDALARDLAGKLGGKIGVAPRLFLKKLVAMLDLVDEHPEFEPVVHHRLALAPAELNADEREAAGLERSVDDIELDIDTGSGAGERLADRGPRGTPDES